MPRPAKTKSRCQDTSLDIASEPKSPSRSANKPGKQALQDRSVNILPAAQKRDGVKSNGSKKRKSESNEDHVEADGVGLSRDSETPAAGKSTNSNPNKKAKQAESTSTTAGIVQKQGANSKPRQSAGQGNLKVNYVSEVSSVVLKGEEGINPVPVYDTCDDIRAKINRFLRDTPSATNAGFVRDINAVTLCPSIKNATAAQLSAFLKRHGPTDGAESPVFYRSYVFFEKLRIVRGKPKTKKRLEMENVWKASGMDLTDLGKTRVWCGPNQTAYTSVYGELQIVGRWGR
ncbi:hypothetical protein AYL99_04906 [Fonsecaea erecta]|uniref:DUF7726 domain-containing protein n=1 Tax=Fonsecaea erecta TaxID=1367422 RepID=A0A178ZJD5_9EURO|nr:hypothetical protein AYL99_04906 [Fonsecaea erecta]OAP59904.1 hypothetical protein AYL99_04906 [Fonsecaea erecta]